MKDIEIITDEAIIDSIIKYIEAKRSDENLKVAFPNSLLKEDVLDLLDRFCTVIYYPLEDESNNGFHTNILAKNGKECHFVFINTAQTTEKQVFTAAHELGHVWKVDEYVAQTCKLSIDSAMRESIINRFAAELLIPKTQFLEFFFAAYFELKQENGSLTVGDVLKLIAKTMNFFFVPMKAVVLRLLEFKIISKETAAKLFGQCDIPEEVIQNEIEQLIKGFGYTKLLSSSHKIWIEGLSEMIDVVEESHIFPSSKMDAIRKTFNMQKKSNDGDLANTVELTVSKEDKTRNED